MSLGGANAHRVWLSGIIIKSIITAMDHFISDVSASFVSAFMNI